MILRDARPTDLPRMNVLAFESKAAWGYDLAQLEKWRSDLETRPGTIGEWPTFVADADGALLAFVQLDPTQEPWELTSLWIDPAHWRKGIGRALLQRARGFAARAGRMVLTIDADPNALSFYVASGAVVVGHIAAPIDGQLDRTRPQLRLLTKSD